MVVLQFFLLSEMSEVQQISLSQNILGQMSAQITYIKRWEVPIDVFPSYLYSVKFQNSPQIVAKIAFAPFLSKVS